MSLNSAGLVFRRRAAHAAKGKPPSQAEQMRKLRADLHLLQRTVVAYRHALQDIAALENTSDAYALWQMTRLAKAALRGEPAEEADETGVPV